MRKLSSKSIAARNGITLLEVMLSVAILSILAAVVTAAIGRYQSKSDLDLSVLSAAELLRRAEILSRASANQSGWGVKLATGTITIFRGGSFASRDQSFDEATEISSAISITGTDEIVFSAIGATTSGIGTTTFTHLSINESRSLYINSRGALEY